MLLSCYYFLDSIDEGTLDCFLSFILKLRLRIVSNICLLRSSYVSFNGFSYSIMKSLVHSINFSPP